ncbi:hypothetical protein Q31b_50970 [Novipirellula aureliae]|uniref:Uncharacterized protein n=1 Tax=Novipirellula aureliae TaxID=2527966 RepID=A0A5C6DG97_9BACT|nr:hypothetical protein [Novipirellula aureliae]TWU35662.1 hypothetical protein Q31b_50970 [Novipirellula aureliae]
MSTQSGHYLALFDGASPAPYTIEILGTFSKVGDQLQAIASETLVYETIEPSAIDVGTIQFKMRPISLCWQKHGTFFIPTGLVPRLNRELQNRAVAASIVDRRYFDPRWFKVSESDAKTVEGVASGFADAIRLPTESVIEVLRGRRRWKLIAAVCSFFRCAKVFVITARKADAAEGADCISEFGSQAKAVHGTAWRDTTRVVVGTHRAFANCYQEDWHAIILEDAAESYRYEILEQLSVCYRHRVFAFANPGETARTKANLMRFEHLAGPVIYPPLAAKNLPPILHAASYRAPQRIISQNRRTRTEEIYRFEDRNLAIARMADAVARRDPESLLEYGLDFGPSLGVAGQMIKIWVESRAHGEILKRMLPSAWMIRSISDAYQEIDDIDTELSPRDIVTSTAIAHQGRIAADFIIVASGSLPLSLLRISRFSATRTTIIDLLDESNDILAAECRQRFEGYRQAGFELANLSRLTALDAWSTQDTEDTQGARIRNSNSSYSRRKRSRRNRQSASTNQRRPNNV